MMDVSIQIPTYRKIISEHGTSFTVFCVEVTHAGRTHVVERRYTDFEELHKKLKRSVDTTTFPPKTVMKWNGRVLESRRLAFEEYLQGILGGEKVPRSLLSFLDLPIDSYSASMESLDKLSDSSLTHQPILTFVENSYLMENQKDSLPDIVITGVAQGFYGSAEDF